MKSIEFLESTAGDIDKMFGNMFDPNFAALQRVALLAMQGRQDEARSHLSRVIKSASPEAQAKITSAVDKIQPVTINGKVADSSTLSKSEKHNKWIIEKFIPWVESAMKQGMSENFADTVRKSIAGAALAGSMAMGSPAMAANLPDLVAVITMQVEGKIIRKEINLGNEYVGPTEAAQAVDKFMASKGIRNYSVDIQCVGAKDVNENFHDGKKPGRKGLAKRVGVNCKQPVSKLRSIAKNSSGEKQRMAHWCANMKSGKRK